MESPNKNGATKGGKRDSVITMNVHASLRSLKRMACSDQRQEKIERVPTETLEREKKRAVR